MMPNPKNKILFIFIIILSVAGVIAGLCYWLLFGKISISGIPTNSTIYIDGNQQSYTGTTFEKRLYIKDYLVQILCDDYIPYEKTVTIRPGQKTTVNEPLTKFFISKALAENVSSISTFNDKDKYYYISDGILYKTDKNFASTKLTAKTLGGVDSIFWSPDQKLAVTLTNEFGQLFDFKQYDILSQTTTPWRDGIKSAVWLDNDRILYYYAPPTGEKSLISTNKGHTEVQTLLDLRQYMENNGDLILVPGSNLDIFIIGKDVINFNLSTRMATPITGSGNIVKGAISPDKKYLSLLTKDELVFYDITTKSIIDTDSAPSLSVMTWQGDKVYYIDNGRLASVSPATPKSTYLNVTKVPILDKTTQMTSVDQLIVILADSKLFNIKLE